MPGWPSGSTRLACVIGDPVRHSLSPTVHNAAFRELGLDWVLVALEVAPAHLPAAVEGWRALGVAGASVTMPHKEAVVDLLDEVSDDAAALGAVNCVVVEDGRLLGHNTDGAGFVASLQGAGGRPAAALTGRTVVLGTGGAARAVARAVALSGAAEVALVSRDPDRARAVADSIGSGVVGASAAAVGEADLVVNATPVGMAEHPGRPCPPEALRADAVVVDLVYHPLETEWLAACRTRGLEVANGVPMLVHQAAVAFELWTGRPAPVPTMTSAATARLGVAGGPD